jgi:hypothetical protein
MAVVSMADASCKQRAFFFLHEIPASPGEVNSIRSDEKSGGFCTKKGPEAWTLIVWGCFSVWLLGAGDRGWKEGRMGQAEAREESQMQSADLTRVTGARGQFAFAALGALPGWASGSA